VTGTHHAPCPQPRARSVPVRVCSQVRAGARGGWRAAREGAGKAAAGGGKGARADSNQFGGGE